MSLRAWVFTCLCLLSPCLFAGEKPELWLYYATNLQVDKNVDELEQIWSRAAEAGYTHVMLTDSKFAKLGDLGEAEKRYFANVEKVKRIASHRKLQIVPALFDVGYSNSLLWHNPNLAEGLPVVEQPFIVHNGEAVPAMDPPVTLGKKFGFKDDNVLLDAGIATVQDTGNNARFSYQLKVPKYRCYRLSVFIKTEHFKGDPKIAVIDASGTKRSLQWQNLGVKHDQDWTQHQVIFNSLDSDAVNIYFGAWGGGKGKLQWKDWKIEEVGLLNVLVRPGAPIRVWVPNGGDGFTLTPGKDYAPIVDPHLGNTPYKGEFEVNHTPPVIKILDAKKYPDGTKLLVNWYHPAIVYGGQVAACITEPATRDLLADQAKRMRQAWSTTGYMMQYDEFRCFNWDASCRGQEQTPGKLLADNARFCTQLLEGSEIYTWNDMFDPFHNAVKGPYYLVNGDWSGSWEGLDKKVVVVNWNHGHRDESLKFFADRGHRQLIAGFYDSPIEKNTKDWLNSTAKVKGVVGMMYTTWRHDFSKIEAFAEACAR